MRTNKNHLQIGLIILLLCEISIGQNKLNKSYNNQYLSLQLGLNITDFQNAAADPKLGYTAGITYQYYFSESFGLDFSVLISHQDIYAKNRRTAALSGEYVHRIIYDTEVSFLFIELPLIFKYKIWSNNSTYFYMGVGLGYSISIQDHSKNINKVTTGEILEIAPPVDPYYIEESVFDNSGININAAAYIIHGKFVLSFQYHNKRYDLREIDKVHSVILCLGYILP